MRKHTFSVRIFYSPLFLVLSGIGALTALLALILYVEPVLDPTGKNGLLSLQLAFHIEKGREVLEIWGDTGRPHYLATVWIDFVYPLCYSLFFSNLAHALPDQSPGRKGLILLPFLAAILDAVENVLEITFVLSYPGFAAYPEWLFFLHSLVSLAKWSIALVIIGGLILSFIRNLLYGKRAKQSLPDSGE